MFRFLGLEFKARGFSAHGGLHGSISIVEPPTQNNSHFLLQRVESLLLTLRRHVITTTHERHETLNPSRKRYAGVLKT